LAPWLAGAVLHDRLLRGIDQFHSVQRVEATMFNKVTGITAAAAFSIALVGNAYAGAQLSGATGGVLVNSGTGFQTVAGSHDLKSGDRVMASPDGKATINFADGCSVPLQAGSVVTIGEKSPCSFQAQGMDGTTIALGLGGAVLLGLGIWALTDNKSKKGDFFIGPVTGPMNPGYSNFGGVM